MTEEKIKKKNKQIKPTNTYSMITPIWKPLGMLLDPQPEDDAPPSEATPYWWRMKNGNQQQSQQQYEILPLYYNKFAQPYQSEDRLGILCCFWK